MELDMKSKMAVTARYFKIELNIRPYWKNDLKIYFSGSIEPYTRIYIHIIFVLTL
jgi:hypothetical protein